MRFLSILLVVLISMLSVPCLHEGACMEDTREQTHHQSGNNTQHKEANSCGPLCLCSCCAGFTVPVANSILVTVCIHIPEKPYCLQPSPALPEVHLPIWQPPKLV